MHPNGSCELYPLSRLTKLYDGIEQLEDDVWGDIDGDGSFDGDLDEDAGWVMNDAGVWQPETIMHAAEWEDAEDSDSDSGFDDDAMDVDPEGWNEEIPISIIHSPLRPNTETTESSSSTHISAAPVGPMDAAEVLNVDDVVSDEDDGVPWKRFKVLPSAPPDHAYYSSIPAQPSKSFLGRLGREYRILASSLPGAYE